MEVKKVAREPQEVPFCTVTFTEVEANAFFNILGAATINDICKATGVDDGSIEKLMSTKNYYKMSNIMKED